MSDHQSSSRSRAYSHTRTNSSSSSGASASGSPPRVLRSSLSTDFLSSRPNGSDNGNGNIVVGRTSRSNSVDDNISDGSSSYGGYSIYSPSEAAAAAALRNVKNVQITSASRLRPLKEKDDIHSHFSTGSHTKSSASSIFSLSKNNDSGSNLTSSISHSQTANKLSSVAASAAAFASRPKAKMFNRQTAKLHASPNLHHHGHHGSGGSNSGSTSGGLGGVGGLLNNSSNGSLSSKDNSTAVNNNTNSSPGGSSGGFGSSYKKKSAELTIQTGIPLPSRPSLSERSPLARSSKELSRIASIGSLSTMMDSDKHKHHISFRNIRDAHVGTMLSSSSSNSKLISEQGSIYSFHPSSPGISTLEIKNLGTREDQEKIVESSWSLLSSRVAPLFSGENLRVPVEDLNGLVSMHLNLLIQQGGSAREILTEVNDLLRMGMVSMEFHGNSQSFESGPTLLRQIVETWTFFFTKVLPYLEAVFLPLQAEFDGRGKILSEEYAEEFWGSLRSTKVNGNGNGNGNSASMLNIRQLSLIAFRDFIIIPVLPQLEQHLATLSSLYENASEDDELSAHDIAVRIMQCSNVLLSIHSDDENHERIKHLVKTLRVNWLSGSRSTKDRRGFVQTKLPVS